jgi:hypothetical protein
METRFSLAEVPDVVPYTLPSPLYGERNLFLHQARQDYRSRASLKVGGTTSKTA